MSTTKLMQSLSEDAQLEKQIGCMTGILQLFDRHQILTGRRFYGHKRISSGVATKSTLSVDRENLKSEANVILLPESFPAVSKVALASNKDAGARDSVHHSSEVSRPHPADLVEESWTFPNKEYSSLARHSTSVPGKSVNGRDNGSKAIMASKIESPRVSIDIRDSSRVSVDIRDVVRVSLGRELPKVSTDKNGGIYEVPTPQPETKADKDGPSKVSFIKETRRNDNMVSKQLLVQREAHGDLSNVNDSTVNGSLPIRQHSKEPPWNSTNLNESLRMLAMLREAPWNLVLDTTDAARPSVDSRNATARISFSRDAPRFSCDERDPYRSSSVDSKECIKSSQKTKEAPRLSLDSKLGPNPCLQQEKTKFWPPEASRGASWLSAHPNFRINNQSRSSTLLEKEAPLTGNRCSTNVVARLMGLEELPATSPEIKLEGRGLSSGKKHSLHYLREDAELLRDGRKDLGTNINPILQDPTPKNAKNDTFPSFEKHWEFDDLRYGENQKPPNPFHVYEVQSPKTRCWNQQDVAPKISTVESSFCKEWIGKKRSQQEETDSTTILVEQFYKELDKQLQQMGLQNSDQEFRTLGQLLDALKSLATSNSRCPTPIGDRKRVYEAMREFCMKLQSYHRQESTCNQGCAEQATEELRCKKVWGQRRAMPRGSVPIFSSHVYGKPGKAECSAMTVKPAATHDRSQWSRKERTSNCIVKHDKAVTRSNGNREDMNLANMIKANKNRYTKRNPVRFRETAAESLNSPLASKALRERSSNDAFPCSSVKSRMQKQNKSVDRGKKMTTAGTIMKDKEERRANLLMQSLKSQSCPTNSSSAGGRIGSGQQSNSCSYHKSLDNVCISEEVQDKVKLKNTQNVLSSNLFKVDNIPSDEMEPNENKEDIEKTLQPSLEPPLHILTRTSGVMIRRVSREGSPWTEELVTQDSNGKPEGGVVSTVLNDERAESGGCINNGPTKRLINDKNTVATQREDSKTRDKLFYPISPEQQQRKLVTFQNENGVLEQLELLRAKGCHNHGHTWREGTLISEQPSPVSVLDAPFTNELDDSPSKCVSEIQGSEVGKIDACGWVRSENNPTTLCCTDSASQTPNQWFYCNADSDYATEVREQVDELQGGRDPAGFIDGKTVVNGGIVQVSAEAELFSLLGSGCIAGTVQCQQDSGQATQGVTKRCTGEAAAKLSHLSRRLLFDAVSEILEKKLHPRGVEEQSELSITGFPWCLYPRSSTSSSPVAVGAGRRCRGEEFVREVCEELDRLIQAQAQPLESLICDVVLKSVGSTDVFQADACCVSDWRDQDVEMAEIAVGIEQSIFKSILNETIGDLVCMMGRRQRSSSADCWFVTGLSADPSPTVSSSSSSTTTTTPTRARRQLFD